MPTRKDEEDCVDAASVGDLTRVKHFIEVKGVSVECKDVGGLTPLKYAALKGHLDVTAYLISWGAEINYDGTWSPLHCASANDQIPVMKLLLENGADVNARAGEEETALHWACQNGSLAAVKLLLEHGADLSIKNIEGTTPLDDAKDGNEHEVVAFLEEFIKAKEATHKKKACFVSVRKTAPQDVFISLRFGEALAAGEALKRKLESRGLNVFLCAVQAGDDVMNEVVSNIHTSKLVVILGTKTYGVKTAAPFSTHEELKYIVSQNKDMFLVRMCDKFDEAIAVFHLDSGVLYHPWFPHNESEMRQVPSELVDAIVTKYNTITNPNTTTPTPKATPTTPTSTTVVEAPKPGHGPTIDPSDPQGIRNMGVDELQLWLEDNGLKFAMEKFSDLCISGEDFMDFSPDDLADLDIRAVHVKLLLKRRGTMS